MYQSLLSGQVRLFKLFKAVHLGFGVLYCSHIRCPLALVLGLLLLIFMWGLMWIWFYCYSESLPTYCWDIIFLWFTFVLFTYCKRWHLNWIADNKKTIFAQMVIARYTGGWSPNQHKNIKTELKLNTNIIFSFSPPSYLYSTVHAILFSSLCRVLSFLSSSAMLHL